MPIDSLHPAYTDNIARWKRCRAAYEGEDAIKQAGAEYLPRLSGQTDDEYAAYVKRALFYEAVGRSIDGFVGAIARKPPGIKLPKAMEAFEKDVTTSGIGLVEFVKKLCSEDLLSGRLGLLVDFDEDANRPYLKVYTAESITNWGPGFVVLKETEYAQEPSDPFALKAIEQYRELTLGDGGSYIIKIWRKKDASAAGGAEWAIFETIHPTKLGRPLNKIPFFWLSCYGQSEKIEKPPLLGLVNVAISHYRTSADLEHGRHFAGLPTLWVSGISDTSTSIRIGAAAAILLSDAAARVGYAEFSGQGLGSLEKALESKEHMMAVLGGAVFGYQRKGVESADTARIRTSGETSLLMSVVTAVEETLEAALRFAGEWMSTTGEIDIAINRDFIDTILDPQTLTALLKSYLSGAISLQTFLFNLRQAEMIDPARTIEEEMAGLPKQPAVQGQDEDRRGAAAD